MIRHEAPPESWDCTIRLSQIPRSGEIFRERFELPLGGEIEHWGQIYTSIGPVQAEIAANYSSERILAKVSVRANFTLPCSRCLTDTGVAIIGDLRYLFTLRPERKETDDDEDSGEHGQEDGDVDVIPVDSFQAEIDFTPYIWEVLILNLPERIICRDDCEGLCPVCGTNRNERDCGCREENVDPRFEVLRDLG